MQNIIGYQIYIIAELPRFSIHQCLLTFFFIHAYYVNNKPFLNHMFAMSDDIARARAHLLKLNLSLFEYLKLARCT